MAFGNPTRYIQLDPNKIAKIPAGMSPAQAVTTPPSIVGILNTWHHFAIGLLHYCIIMAMHSASNVGLKGCLT
jgi:hypothetical protein